MSKTGESTTTGFLLKTREAHSLVVDYPVLVVDYPVLVVDYPVLV